MTNYRYWKTKFTKWIHQKNSETKKRSCYERLKWRYFILPNDIIHFTIGNLFTSQLTMNPYLTKDWFMKENMISILKYLINKHLNVSNARYFQMCSSIFSDVWIVSLGLWFLDSEYSIPCTSSWNQNQRNTQQERKQSYGCKARQIYQGHCFARAGKDSWTSERMLSLKIAMCMNLVLYIISNKCPWYRQDFVIC